MALALIAALALGALLIVVVAVSLGSASKAPAATARGGCTLTKSSFGYPDSYLTRQVRYTKHPPFPLPGWHAPDEPIRFERLFHSVFHGYVVVEYRADLPPKRLQIVRSWVQRNAGRRVTAATAEAGATYAVDVAKWGYELRCERDSMPTAAKLDRFLRLPSRS